jgi:hypothetical protein
MDTPRRTVTPRHHEVKPGGLITRRCARPVKTGNQDSGFTSRVHLLHIDAKFLLLSLSQAEMTILRLLGSNFLSIVLPNLPFGANRKSKKL